MQRQAHGFQAMRQCSESVEGFDSGGFTCPTYLLQFLMKF